MTRVYCVCLDGAPPNLMARFAADGTLPALAKILSTGTWSRAMPSLPTITSVNWTTMVSGVHCGAHGRPYSNRKLKYFWEAAVEAGIPVGVANVEHNDLGQGFIYVGHPRILAGPIIRKIGTGESIEIPINSAEGTELVRVDVVLDDGFEAAFRGSTTAKIRAVNSEMSQRVTFTASDEARTPLCTSIRQLAELSSIYISPLREAAGFCQPRDLEKKILQMAGPPPVRGFPLFHRQEAGLETALDEEMYHAAWFGRAAVALMGEHDDALWFHRHNTTDGIGHYYLGLVDESAYCYEPENLSRNWEAIRRWYQTVERVLGTILELDPEAKFAMCTDHGHHGYRRLVSVPRILAQKGLVEADPERPTSIDEARSKVLPKAEEIFINRDTRHPPGPVGPDQYDEIRDRVIEALGDAVDPLDGSHPVALAIRREDAQVLHFWGEDRGDVLYLLKGGYFATPAITEDAFRQFCLPTVSSVHHGSFPGYETDVGSSFSFMAFSGGHGGEWDIDRLGVPHLVDFGPTVLAMLGLKPPPWLQGRVVHGMIGGDTSVSMPRTGSHREP